ncbi:hypothetical protein [Alteromonas sp. BMJM2]|uniref:hypothetical protein n=1 Tax=Alteromonas sp. BMJM2 TaxID=2954241 RepID=UPI0022B363D7|nr:hypothetical protein [Alteromonas sp. BMJM2]
MSKRKKYNPLKHAEARSRAQLKNTAIGCVPAQGPCQFLSLTNSQLIPMTQDTFQLISNIRHKWTVFIAVVGIDDFGSYYMKSDEIEVNDPQFQKDMVETLNKHHKALIDTFNQKHLLSVGWLATPYKYSWDVDQAYKLLVELGVTDFVKDEENEVYKTA